MFRRPKRYGDWIYDPYFTPNKKPIRYTYRDPEHIEPALAVTGTLSIIAGIATYVMWCVGVL